MDKNGWAAAQLAWERSHELLLQLRNAKSIDEACRAWSDFLIQHNRVFTKLYEASKIGGSSDWYGHVKGERKNSDEMRYLMQARNADEHGIAPIHEEAHADLRIGAPGESVNISMAIVGGKVYFDRSNGRPLPAISTRPKRIELIDVVNYKIVYSPPINPYSKFKDKYSPVELAEYGTRFAWRKLQEAKLKIVGA